MQLQEEGMILALCYPLGGCAAGFINTQYAVRNTQYAAIRSPASNTLGNTLGDTG
jgi:hypothetical protein